MQPRAVNHSVRTDDVDDDLSNLFEALDDRDCRLMIRALQSAQDELTAHELSEECGIPPSTVYRKLKLLRDARMVRESTQLRPNGKHTGSYKLSFDEICVRITEDGFYADTPPGDID